MTRSRILIPLAAALAVLVLTGGIWWMTAGSDDDGGSSAQPAASSPGEDKVDTPSGDGEPGNPGSGTSTDPDPGYGKPGAPPPDDDPAPGPAPGSVPIDSYVVEGPRSLTLNYVIGVPECYGTVTGVRVHETARAVVLTLVHQPAEPSDEACIDIAMLKSIPVQLPSPLGDRALKDGAYGDKVVERTDAAYEDGGD